MPRGDGFGPAGMGPMTGRAAGYCAGFAAPGFVNSGRGRGRGAGFGGGWGWRTAGRGYGYHPSMSPAPLMPEGYGFQPQDKDAQLRFLTAKSQMLRESLDNIQKQIEALGEQDTA